jgi:hypothetical protein
MIERMTVTDLFGEVALTLEDRGRVGRSFSSMAAPAPRRCAVARGANRRGVCASRSLRWSRGYVMPCRRRNTRRLEQHHQAERVGQ